MNQDAANIIRSIDPNAQILSPSGHVWTMTTWFDPYIAAGGAATFDIVNMHMRGNGDALNVVPESFLTTYANIVSDVQANGLGSRPLWDSEHGIKADENVTDPDTLAGVSGASWCLAPGSDSCGNISTRGTTRPCWRAGNLGGHRLGHRYRMAPRPHHQPLHGQRHGLHLQRG